jgi:hypothetical protein
MVVVIFALAYVFMPSTALAQIATTGTITSSGS